MQDLNEFWDNTPRGTQPSVEPPASDPHQSLWIDAGDWEEELMVERQWVTEGYMLRGAVTMLIGPPSAMKSSLTLAWSCALALGREYGEFAPRNGPKRVLVYNVEDDAMEQRRRLSAVLRQFSATPADIAGKVMRTGPNGVGTLVKIDRNGNLLPTPAMDELEELIREFKPDVVFLDPFSELHGSEENDNGAVRAVVAHFRAMAVLRSLSVVLLHHTSKAGASAAPGDPNSARGASSAIGAVRVALTLNTMSEDDAKLLGLPTDRVAREPYVRLDGAKSNYAKLASAEWFQKVPHRLDNGDWAVAAEPWMPPVGKVADDWAVAALDTAISAGIGGEPYSPKLDNEKRSVKILLAEHGFHGSAAKNALDKLLMNGVEIAEYRNVDRNVRKGLRASGKPDARWLDRIKAAS